MQRENKKQRFQKFVTLISSILQQQLFEVEVRWEGEQETTMILLTEGYFQTLLDLLLDTLHDLDHIMDIPKVDILPKLGTLLKAVTLPKAGILLKAVTLPKVGTLLPVGTLHLDILPDLLPQDIHQQPIRSLVDIHQPVIRVHQLHIIQGVDHQVWAWGPC